VEEWSRKATRTFRADCRRKLLQLLSLVFAVRFINYLDVDKPTTNALVNINWAAAAMCTHRRTAACHSLTRHKRDACARGAWLLHIRRLVQPRSSSFDPNDTHHPHAIHWGWR
jgi:hypothetical protein